MSDPPILWQYAFSNFNEKARWALDHKGVAHVRRSLLPGSPRQIQFMIRGTLPVLELDGERIMDSSAIIAALEERFDGPSLYPADAEARRQALELEDFFDEHAGHEVRRVFFWEARDDVALMTAVMSADQPRWAKLFLRAGFPIGWQVMKRRYRFYEEDAAGAHDAIRVALDRIEDEREGREYLVGDSFTVADLTAAALLYPLALPLPEFPYRLPEIPPTPNLDELRAHPAVGWIRDTWRARRRPSPGPPP